MRKHRILAICLLITSLCLGACGPAGEDRSPAETVKGTEEAGRDGEKEASDEKEPSNGKEENGQETGAFPGGEALKEAEDLSLLSLIISSEGDYVWEEERMLCHTSYPKLWLDRREDTSSQTGEQAFPKLAAALEEMNNQTRERMEESLKEMESQAREMEMNDYFTELSEEEEVWVVRGDSRILSMLKRSSSYEGGAHGMYMYQGITLDSQSGREMGLNEIVTDPRKLVELAADRLVEKYPDVQFFEPPKEVMLRELDGGYLSWVAGYDGVTFYFSPYELAAYAAGSLTVTILFEEEPELFVPQVSQVPEAWAVRLAPGMDYDLGHDGTLETLEVWTDVAEEGDAYAELILSVNGRESTQNDLWFYQYTPYLVHLDDLSTELLMVETTSDNDYRMTMIFDLNSDGQNCDLLKSFASTGFSNYWETTEDGTFENGTEIFTDPKHVSLMTRFDLLSTYNGSRWYEFCEEAEADGYLKPEQPWYEVERGEYPLTLLIPVDMETGEEGKVETFPEGTRLWIVRTDGNYVEFLTEDDRRCRVYVESAEWPGRIRGVEDRDITEIFDGMRFAG